MAITALPREPTTTTNLNDVATFYALCFFDCIFSLIFRGVRFRSLLVFFFFFIRAFRLLPLIDLYKFGCRKKIRNDLSKVSLTCFWDAQRVRDLDDDDEQELKGRRRGGSKLRRRTKKKSPLSS